jgi:MFS family permease
MYNEIENILEKAGRNEKYQYISLIILFILFGTSEYLVVILPFLEAKPRVEYYDKTLNTTIVTTINYTICDNYEFSIIKENLKYSLIYELGIYCDKSLTVTLGICLFGGIMIGSSIAYIFADRKGRKATLLFFSIACVVLNIIFYFVQMLIPVFIIIFLSGVFSAIIDITILVYVSEMIKKQNLILFTSTIFCGFSFFGTIYTVIFYLFDEWRIILIVVSAFMLLAIIAIYVYLEESPIFYISIGNEEMFTQSVKNIARKNDRIIEDTDLTLNNETEYDPNRITKNNPFDRKYSSDNEILERLADSSPIFVDFENIKQTHPKESNESSDLDDCNNKTPNKELYRMNTYLSEICIQKEKAKRKMMKDFSVFDLIILDSQRPNFLILSYIWVVISVIFYGLSINIKNIYGNLYIQYYYIFLCDMVISFIGGLLSNYHGLGRKKTIILLLLISFCCFMTSIFFDEESSSSLFSVCLYISRTSLIALNCIIYCYTNEIYPTVLRTKGLGVNITISKLGGIIAPFVIENLDAEMLLMIFCIINLFAIMFSFILPETLTRRMAFHPPEMSGIIEENFD